MRREYMLQMDAEELDRYADTLGIDATGLKTVKAKVSLIEKRRARTARVPLLGAEVEVPVKRLHDRRFTERIHKVARGRSTDDEMYELMADLLGEEQVEGLVERATDEDGTVDVEAIGYAFAALVRSPELKKF